MDKLNTHYYDGSLKQSYKELLEKQNSTTDFHSTTWTIQMLFSEIQTNLEKIQLDPNTKKGIQRVLHMIYKDTRGNYDPINDIQTIDILCRTWYFVRKEPIEDQKTFFEQLFEINNGTCSQGRTTRLFQILSCYLS